MKIVSFNVNGLRARLHQLQKLSERYEPDIIGLQETKVSDEEFPLAAVNELGYDCLYHGQKGHYGVALLYKVPLFSSSSSIKGLPGQDPSAQRRFVQGSFSVNGKVIHVINGYFPQGENREHPVKFPNKADFYSKLQHHLSESFSPEDNVVVMGDMNIAPQDSDIGIGDDNRKRWLRTGKCCFLPEERDWLNSILDLGYADSFRHLHPDNSTAFSWFDYRSRGFERDPRRGLRIDLILTSKALTSKISAAGIHTSIRAMEKPSDHCPVSVDLSF